MSRPHPNGVIPSEAEGSCGNACERYRPHGRLPTLPHDVRPSTSQIPRRARNHIACGLWLILKQALIMRRFGGVGVRRGLGAGLPSRERGLRGRARGSAPTVGAWCPKGNGASLSRPPLGSSQWSRDWEPAHGATPPASVAVRGRPCPSVMEIPVSSGRRGSTTDVTDSTDKRWEAAGGRGGRQLGGHPPGLFMQGFGGVGAGGRIEPRTAARRATT